MRVIFLLPFFLLFLYACNPSDEKNGNPNKFGGTLKINETYCLSTLFPHCIKDQSSSHIASQIYEGLAKYEASDLSVSPAIAAYWEIDSTETTYRFYLNNNVYFNNDECFTDGIGRKVTAQDFIYTFNLLASQNENNVCFFGSIDNIKGASEHYFGNNSQNISGIKAENDTLLIIQLEKPNPLFLYLLASPVASVIPHEAFEKYGYKSTVGCGPFYISHFSNNGEPLILQRNVNYHQKDKSGNFLPYLDSIIVTFNGSVKKELSMLCKGELDIVYNVDNNSLTSFLEKNITQFKGEKPTFILQVSNFNPEFQLQHIMKKNIKGFITNSQNYYDLSKVYIEPELPDSSLVKN